MKPEEALALAVRLNTLQGQMWRATGQSDFARYAAPDARPAGVTVARLREWSQVLRDIELELRGIK